MVELDQIIEENINDTGGHALAVKELTSVKVEKRKTNMDFKTRLTIQEISAHGCMDFLNDVIRGGQEKFSDELLIVNLIDKMKRLRVSEGGKAREGIEQIFRGEKQEENSNFLRKLFSPRNPQI
jgi:hypothetical protein